MVFHRYGHWTACRDSPRISNVYTMSWIDQVYTPAFDHKMKEEFGDWWESTHRVIMSNKIKTKTMERYIRKQDAAIEAIQWDGTEEMAIDVAHSYGVPIQLTYNHEEFLNLYIETQLGLIRVEPNGYIIKSSPGEYYACTAAAFEQAYEKI